MGDSMGKVGLLQFDPTVGDLEQNVHRLSSLATQAEQAGATVGISTELAVCGYPATRLVDGTGFCSTLDAGRPQHAGATPGSHRHPDSR